MTPRDHLLHTSGVRWLEGASASTQRLMFSLLPATGTGFAKVSPAERSRVPSLRTIERFFRSLDNGSDADLRQRFRVVQAFGARRARWVAARDILCDFRAQRRSLSRRQFNMYCSKARGRVTRLRTGVVLRVDTGQLCFLRWLVESGYVDAVRQWQRTPAGRATGKKPGLAKQPS